MENAMKFNKMIAFCALALISLSGCAKYDDSSLWNDIDQSYNQLTEIKSQLEMLSSQIDMLAAVVEGGAVTGISKNDDGGYTVRYKGADNEEKTVVLASKDDVNTAPVIGVKKDADVLYWTITTGSKTDWLKDVDGAKIPVAGRTPAFTIDAEGCWCINGNPVLDAAGNKVKAEGKTFSVISDVQTDSSGNAVLTLVDGSTVTVPLFEAFSISLRNAGNEFMNRLDLDGVTGPVVLDYVISGPSAGNVVVKVRRKEGLEAAVDMTAKTVTLTFPEGFEEGSFALMVADMEGNVLVRPVYVTDKSAVPEYYGIKTADDLAKFAAAVNSGAPLKRYLNQEGNVVLLSDVDMSGVESWIPAGTDAIPFEGVFDGQGFAIRNISFTTDVTSALHTAIFGVVGKAEIRNLTVGAEGDVWTVTGTAAANTAIAGVVAKTAEESGAVVTGCTNNVSFDFKAVNENKQLAMIAGIVADASDVMITGCTNNADVHVKDLVNTANGGTGLNLAGIAGYARDGVSFKDCVNNGDLSAPAGRGGGIVATMANSTVVSCINNGRIEDDVHGQNASNAKPYDLKRMGGIVGGTTGTTSIEDCTNNGTVITWLGCRTGGLVGHNSGNLSGCVNKGDVFGASLHKDHGAAWACGFTSANTNVVNCEGYGHVGDISHKDSPESAPHASHYNAVKYKYMERYDPEANRVDWTVDSYYDWTATDTKELAAGLKFTSYQWNNVPRKMNVLEIDLTSTAFDLTTAMADDIVPNPNANGNNNNGFKVRETLSQLCARKRAEGEDVLAGINTGFFDSNDGFPRGIHIEEGEPVYVNNQGVRNSLTNHAWAFTVFTDGTASCEKKTFRGSFEVAGKEYEYYSVNDTIVRRGHKTYMANVYTSRYKAVPHADRTDIVNVLAKSALYIVASYSSDVMKVNAGYAEAKVTAIHDGRATALSEAPYLTEAKEFALQLTGAVADEVAAAVKVGDVIRIKADVTVGSETKPVQTQNSTMYQFVKNGKNTSSSVGEDNANNTKYDPLTFVGVSESGTKVWLIQIDGRQISKEAWTSMGVKAYEMAEIALRLGAYDMTRFDGGGSSAMWVYADGEGKLVNTPSDKNGERSCMNYIYLRARK